MPRTGTVLKLAAAVVAGGIAVAACGSVQMGAAAIVGGQRISAAQLNAEVVSYNTAYQRYHGAVQQQFASSQAPQVVLGWLVSFRVADRMAQRYGITVTPAAQRSALSGVLTELRQQSPGATVGELGAAIGLAPDMQSRFARFEAIQNAVAARLDGGKEPASGSAAAQTLQTTFIATQCRAAKSLGIRVNPQFGYFDYRLNDYGAYSVLPASSALSKAQPSASPSSDSGAEPTAHC